MKKVVLVLAFGFFSLFSLFAGTVPGLDSEMEQKVVVDLSEIQLDKYVEDYVLVSFNIVDGIIKIDEISGTQVVLTKAIIKELVQMRVESKYDADVTYRYKFTFEKV